MRKLAIAAATTLALCGHAYAGHGAPVVAPGSSGEDGVPNVGDARVEVYGQAMMDAIYDFNRMNPDWAATLRPSQIPITCPGDPGCGENGQFLFSIRQSSLGVRAFIPTSMGMVKTDLAFDLFGTDGGTNIHWLRAWAEMGMYGVGQNDSNFMDMGVFPNTIDYWGPSGMVFVRNPQFRITPISANNQSLAVSLEAPNSAIDTGKVTAVDPGLGAGIQAKNKWPDLVVSYRYGGDWGYVRGAGIVRSVGYHNTASADGQPSKQLTGYGMNVTGTVKVFGKDQFNWGLVAGKAIASYMNDGGVDIAPDATLHGQAVTSYGYLLYYNHAWNDKWSSAIGASEHKQNTSDGQFDSAFRRGSYASVNVLYQLTKNVMSGGEFIWGRKSDKGGASANDSRLQWSTRVSF
jgi:hypothetical protein